ncbi:hypothetical protein ACHWQZ_G006340 [Mnemiopsis leidyi]
MAYFKLFQHYKLNTFIEIEMCDLLTENLHELINKEEYENKKLVRLIDYEKEKQATLQTQINDYKSRIDETEKQNALLSREVQDVERQITANQSLITTLTCANKMSHQHVAETHKKLARLLEDGKKRAEQYEKALQRYQDTWSNHQKVYCSFPGVPQIMLLEDEVLALQSKVGGLEKKLTDIRQKKRESQEFNTRTEKSEELLACGNQNVEMENFSEIAEQVTVSEISMETNENPSETHGDNQCTAQIQNQEPTEMEIEDTNQEEDMIVDSVTSEVASEQCRDLEIAENSPYFTSTENLDKDKVKQFVQTHTTSNLLSSSTPNIACSVPSLSPFNNVSPVLPEQSSASPSSPKLSHKPITTLPGASPQIVKPGMVASAAVSRRNIPKISAPNRPTITPPASPKVPSVKVPTKIPTLVKPSPRASSPNFPKLATPRTLSSPKPITRPVPRPIPTTPKVTAIKPATIATPKLTTSKLVKALKPPTTPKLLTTPKPLSTPKPANSSKQLTTPKPLSTPKLLSTPKPLLTPKPLSTPKLSSTPNANVPPKHGQVKNVSDLASANSSKYTASPQRENPSSEKFYTPGPVTNRSDEEHQNTSVYTTPATIQTAGNNDEPDANFTFDKFATPQASESMFDGGDSTGDQFNFGFVESESASNSAFGMFGSTEDSTDFGSDSGFGGDSSAGFAFDFGGDEESSSSENNCNALFG